MERILKSGLMVILALALTMPLGACGKKSDLQAPPGHTEPSEE